MSGPETIPLALNVVRGGSCLMTSMVTVNVCPGATKSLYFTFLAARSGGALLGVGALKQLDERRGEVKSMHTAEAARGRGVGRRLVEQIVQLAQERGIVWLGLETGTQPEFDAARSLYRNFGFATCEPFEPYTVNPYSTCLSREITVG